MKKSLATVFAVCLLFATAGCSAGANATVGSNAELSETQLKAILVSKLSADCTGLNAYMLSPSNWESQGASPTGAGTEFMLPGDGGALVLDVLPDGVGGANVVIADAEAYVTNINLYNSGCKTIASPPADDSGESTSSGNADNTQQTGHYEQRCQQVMVPNPQYDPMAGPGVMAMKGISQEIWQSQCSQVWVQQ